MNPNDPTPPQIPPQVRPPVPPVDPDVHALGENPEERQPIPNVLGAIEAILRQPRRMMYQLRQPGAGALIGGMVFIAVLCSLVYGFIIGTFSGHEQMWEAPVKVASGMLIAGIICMPSLYIFGCLSGSQARLIEMVGMVAGLLMLTSILLIGFAPVAWLFSESSTSPGLMGALHLIFWFVSTIFGLRFLNAAFSHSRARSNAGLNTWIVIFVLVVLQMTTALRPILGRSDDFLPKEKKFFLTHWVDSLKEENNKPSSSPSSR